jgi:YD repeat-containing protein
MYRSDDFSTADGSLRLSRIFNSSPYGGAGTSLVGPILGLADWNFDFQYEIQFNDNSYDPDDLVTLVTPSGGAYVFQHGVSGMTPYRPASRPNPQTSFTLSLIDPWPSGGGLDTIPTHWTLKDDQDRIWIFQSYLNSLGFYSRAFPTKVTDRLGHSITFSYNSTGYLQSATDDYGKSLTFDWQMDQSGLSGVISEVHLPNGYAIKYNYNYQGGQVASVLTDVQMLDASENQLNNYSYGYTDPKYPNIITGT